MAEDGKTPTLIVPKVTTDHLRSFLARMPLKVYSDYGRRHFNLFTYVLHRFLGQEWVEKHILAQALGINKGPTAFLEVDFSTDERRELGSLRLFDLAEMLMNLQLVEGFSECIDRLRTGKRDQIEATYAELQFAKLFYVHDMQFRIMVPSGERRSSYDFEIFLPSHPVVCADAKCKIEANNIDPASVRNTLDSARDQFPKDKPSVIFVKVPQHWFARPGMTADLRKVARDFLRGTGRIVSVKYYVSHVTFVNQQTVHRHAFDEIDNPNNRFPPNRNWDFFRGYHVPDEWNGMPPKWIHLMHFKSKANIITARPQSTPEFSPEEARRRFEATLLSALKTPSQQGCASETYRYEEAWTLRSSFFRQDRNRPALSVDVLHAPPQGVVAD